MLSCLPVIRYGTKQGTEMMSLLLFQCVYLEGFWCFVRNQKGKDPTAK